MGLAMAAPIASATKRYADFDDQMRSVGSITRATQSELESLTSTAKELGRTTSFTAVDVASLMTELGRAGFDPSQINRMTGAVLDLARATNTDASLAATVMSASLRQFNLGADDATRVADVLTAAANNSFNSVETLGEALTYAGPVANDFNMSIEETAAILGTLGNVGIQASNAGTVVRRLLTLTGAEAQKMQKIFGVSFVDAAGNARPLIDTLDEVAQATNSLGSAERAEKFNEAFGLLGITGASAISKTATETRKLLKTIKDAGGVAGTTAEQMDAGLGGSLRKVISAAEGVQLALGDAVDEPVQYLVDGLTRGLGGITAFIEGNEDLVKAGAAGAAGLVVLGGGLITIGSLATIASIGLGGLVTAAGLLTSPLVLATGAATGLGVAILMGTEKGGEALDWLKGQFGSLAGTVSESVEGITAAIQNGDMETAWEIATGTLELIWAKMTKGIIDEWDIFTMAVLDTGGSMVEQLGQLFMGLGDFLDSFLDRYKSYYDWAYQKVVDIGGDVSGVKSIGDPSSAFESDFDEEDLRKRIQGVRDFGSNTTAAASRFREGNLQSGSQSIVDRENRIRQLQANLSKTNTREVAQRDVSNAIGESGSRFADSISELLGLGNAQANDVQGSASIPSAGMLGSEGSAKQTGTFSAFGAALLGLGVGSTDERIASASEKQVSLLESIDQVLGQGTVDKATETAVDIVRDPLGAVKDGAAAFQGAKGDAVSFVANQLNSFVGSMMDPGAGLVQNQREAAKAAETDTKASDGKPDMLDEMKIQSGFLERMVEGINGLELGYQ